MATFTLTVQHNTEGDYKGKASDSPTLALQKICSFLQGLSGHVYSGTSFDVSQEPASGTVTLSGVGGTAASGTFTYSSSSGTTVATLNTVTFQQTTGSDSARATALAAAINASTDPLILGLFTASPSSGVVTVTAVHKGVSGNSYALAVSGTGLTRSGATMSGGVDSAVDVAIAGNTVSPDVTDLTDAAAATAVAAAINFDVTDAQYVVASASGTVVTVTALDGGLTGNSITLTSSSDTGTATASGATLSGGTVDTYNL